MNTWIMSYKKLSKKKIICLDKNCTDHTKKLRHTVPVIVIALSRATANFIATYND